MFGSLSISSLGGVIRSGANAPLAPYPPVLLSVEILGTGQIGDEHVASVSGSGRPPPVLAYQWLIDGVAISGATSAAYTPSSGDDGLPLTVEVIATNSEGSASLASTPLIISTGAPVLVSQISDQMDYL